MNNKRIIKTITYSIPALLLGGCSLSLDNLNIIYSRMSNNSTSEEDQYLMSELNSYYSPDSASSDLLVLYNDQDFQLNNLIQDISNRILDITKLVGEGAVSDDLLIEYVKCVDDANLESVVDYLFNVDEPILQKDFLDFVLSSKVNIFTKWYKKALLIASNSTDDDLSFFAKDTLSFYEKEFRQID